MRYIGLFLLFAFSCKRINKPIIHAKTIEESLYRPIDIDYEKIYGNVKTICDSGYFAKEISGKKYGSLEWVILFKFDDKGNEVEVDGFDNDNAFRYKSLYTYNSDGKIEKQYYYRPANKLQYIYVYEYNEKGHPIGYYLYDDDKVLDSKDVDSLDSKGDVIQESLIEKGKLTLTIFAIVYDDKKNIIATHFTNHIDTFEDQFKYDDSDNQIEDISMGKKDKVDSLRYKYTNKDIYGNWLQKWTYRNGTLNKMICRKIAYY